jgi:hypothetical protein
MNTHGVEHDLRSSRDDVQASQLSGTSAQVQILWRPFLPARAPALAGCRRRARGAAGRRPRVYVERERRTERASRKTRMDAAGGDSRGWRRPAGGSASTRQTAVAASNLGAGSDASCEERDDRLGNGGRTCGSLSGTWWVISDRF